MYIYIYISAKTKTTLTTFSLRFAFGTFSLRFRRTFSSRFPIEEVWAAADVFFTFSLRFLYVFFTFSLRILHVFFTFPSTLLLKSSRPPCTLWNVFFTFSSRFLYVFLRFSLRAPSLSLPGLLAFSLRFRWALKRPCKTQRKP